MSSESDPLSIMSLPEVAQMLTVHVSTINRWSSAGRFAPKVQLGPGRIGFVRRDVIEWIALRRPVASAPPCH